MFWLPCFLSSDVTVLLEQLPELFRLGIVFIYVTFCCPWGVAPIDYAFLFLEGNSPRASALQATGRYQSGRWHGPYLRRSEGTCSTEGTVPQPWLSGFLGQGGPFRYSPGDDFLLVGGRTSACRPGPHSNAEHSAQVSGRIVDEASHSTWFAQKEEGRQSLTVAKRTDSPHSALASHHRAGLHAAWRLTAISGSP